MNSRPEVFKKISEPLLNHKLNSSKCGFTLAETLITLAVIGIVAALTIPALIKNYNQKAWMTASKVFERKLDIATKQMNTEEKLAGYSSTLDFVNELKKYINIVKICDNEELTSCFSENIIWGSDNHNIKMEQIKTAKNLGHDSWSTETVGVQFSNGINAIIAYNPATLQEPYNNQFNATSASMAIIYDVSGFKKPNTSNKDIGNINVTSLAGNCLMEIDNICITKILHADTDYTPLNKSDCNEEILEKYNMKYCYKKRSWGGDGDYWAGAVIACGGRNNMPTREQLGTIAKYLYNTDTEIGANTNINCCLTKDPERIIPFGEGDFFIWSNEEIDKTTAYQRYYSFKGTIGYSSNLNYDRDSEEYMALCIGND